MLEAWGGLTNTAGLSIESGPGGMLRNAVLVRMGSR
jgi:hypothetical protein